MDFSTINKTRIFKSEQFRTPSPVEKKIGLWLDRVGNGTNYFHESTTQRLRILGLYAAVFIESGNGCFYSCVTGELQVGAGDTMLLFPNEPNLYYPHTKWETKWIVWHGAEAETIEKLGTITPTNPIVRNNHDAVNQAYSALTRKMRQEDLGAVLERKKIIFDMIIDFYKSQRPAKETQTELVLAKTIRYINLNINKDISVPELAEYCNLSTTHFRRLFRLHTGRSPKEYIIARKISSAKEHLSNGRSIKETAELLGFRDEFYFMRTFKRITGTTAGKF